MWLDLTTSVLSLNPTGRVRLTPVASPEEWDILHNLRAEIEVPFGVVDPVEIARLIDGIRRVVLEFQAEWFLAFAENKAVGEIGLVSFDSEHGKYGRLLDVDIAPPFQGRGYGNELMASIIQIAKERELTALCLKADADRWVKHRYSRLGFKAVGYWTPGSCLDAGIELL